MSPPQVLIAKACLGRSFQDIARASITNAKDYAKLHKYDFVEVNSSTFPEATFFTPGAWVKIGYLQDLLEKQTLHDWILWLDCDALIIKPRVTIQSILQEMKVTSQHHLIFTEDDPAFKSMAPFNSGVFFARNSRWNQQELSEVLRLASDQSVRGHGLWEQEALRRLYMENRFREREHILIASLRWKFNAFDRLHEETAETVIWHRTGCRTQPQCDQKFMQKFENVSART